MFSNIEGFSYIISAVIAVNFVLLYHAYMVFVLKQHEDVIRKAIQIMPVSDCSNCKQTKKIMSLDCLCTVVRYKNCCALTELELHD